MLGIVMKCITGSRKTIDTLNRLGHSFSHTTKEEIVTELNSGENKNKQHLTV